MHSDDVKEKWQDAAKNSNIQPFVFIQLLLTYWIHAKESVPLEIKLERFTQLLHVICLLTSKFLSLEYH